MSPRPPSEYDDLAHLRRQAALAVRSLLRPGAYVGTAREVALTAVHAAAYPLGMARDANRRSRRLDPDGLDAPVADGATAAMPVILVHGWIHNRSAFLGTSRVLRRHGFRHIHAFDYDPLAHDIPEVAGMLAAEVDRVLAVTGAERCMLVGHSMGGVVGRYYVQQLGGDRTVDTVITLGSPHRGTYSAFLGWGASAPQMRPGSPLMRMLEETARPTDVRYVAVYSDLDLLILPAVSAKLVHPALRAHNVKVADLGHLSLLLSGEVMRIVVAHLADRALHRPEQNARGALPFGTEVTPEARRLAAVPPLAAQA
jgi:triacylglycerol lipase